MFEYPMLKKKYTLNIHCKDTEIKHKYRFCNVLFKNKNVLSVIFTDISSDLAEGLIIVSQILRISVYSLSQIMIAHFGILYISKSRP